MSHHSPHRSRPGRLPRDRGGFTLVELLVAVGLVALMMLLFAQVFQLAAGSLTQQKGMAELDQRERMAITLIRGDLRQRSFRILSPFVATGSAADTSVTTDMDLRRGYFSISENDPDDHTDDVLQFTIEQDPTDPESGEELPFSGRATLLKFTSDPASDYDTQSDRNGKLAANPNQPEFDDGVGGENGVGSSRAAEVSYFLRNGNLYRRVLLIRDKFTGSGTSDQPEQTNSGVDYSTSSVGSLTSASDPGIGNGTFWHDFDYSAYHDSDSSRRLRFHYLASLDNSAPSSLPSIGTFGVPSALGIPQLRFGHGLFANDGTTVLDGQPREYDSSGKWIGRFTLQETAHSGFNYPGQGPKADGTGPDSPMDPSTAANIGSNGLVTEFSGEQNRRGEDILLTNVHEFDIKVFDDYVEDQNGNGTPETGEDDNGNGTLDTLNEFVDLGHDRQINGAPAGYYHNSQNQGSQGNRYDTWHPSMPVGFPAPYRPIRPGNTSGWPDDEAPLRAIQIRIRYLDIKSGQMRQLTIGYSLED